MKRKQQDYSQHPWDIAATVPLFRSNHSFDLEELDRGVNFFVLALEALGATPQFSCEGHPRGFYIAFEAEYALALRIQNAGFFSVEVEGERYWSIRKMRTEQYAGKYSEEDKARTLRWAADAWLETFGERLANELPRLERVAA